jgi:tetratricopeptide (TPR) repeat protein
MPEAAAPPALPFEAFLTALGSLGFDTGVERRARLHRVLEHMPANVAPHRLKTVLCPIFASDETQQESFYRIFDRFFCEVANREATIETVLAPVRSSARAPIRFWLVVAANVVWIMILAYTGYRYIPHGGKVPSKSGGQTGGGGEVQFIFPRGSDYALRSAVPPVALHVPLPTVLLRLLPYMLLLALVLYQTLSWIRQQLLLARPPQRDPPATWPDQVACEAGSIYTRLQVAPAARRFRARESVPSEAVDVPKTIRRTIGSLGFVRIAFGLASRRPEHLVLIERQSGTDHLAALSFELVKALRKNGVLLDAYFYDGDAQVCYTPGDNRGLYLDDLYSSNHDRRLIVFGDPRSFSNPYTEAPSTTIAMLRSFRACAVLSPATESRRPASRGGGAPWAAFLPASLEGLCSLSLLWTGARGAAIAAEATPLPPMPPWDELRWREKLSEYVENLRRQVGPDLFRWLCGCALHPQMHWELTLALGESALGRNPTENEIVKLCRLRWFRSEPMPGELRDVLVRQLDRRSERRMRAVVIGFLRKYPAPRGTFAETMQKSAVAAQILALPPRDETRVQENREWTRVLADKEPGWIARHLPRVLRRLMFEVGVPALGLSGAVRPVFAAVSFVLVIAGLWGFGQIPPVRDWPQYRIVLRGKTLPQSTQKCTAHPPPFRTSSGWVGSGSQYFTENDFQCAIEAFTNAIQMDPKAAEAYVGRAASTMRREPRGRPAQARQDLETAIRLAPKLSRAYYWLGGFLIGEPNADHPQALAAARTAAALDVGDSYPHNLLLYLYEDMKEYAAAHREFEEAIRLDPTWALPYNNDGAVYNRENNIEMAMKRYQRAIELDPHFVLARVNLANQLEKRGKLKEAIEECSKALDLAPEARQARMRRAYFYRSLKDYQSAWADSNYVVQHSPDADAYIDRGNSACDLQRFEDGISDYSRALTMRPKYPSAYFDRGLAYRQTSQYQKALADFEQVLALPGSEDLKKRAREEIENIKK